MSEFNRMTIVAAAEVISDFKSRSEMDFLEIQFGITERCISSSRPARAASWAKIAADEPVEVMTESGRTSLARAMVEVAVKAPPRTQGSDAWRKFIAGLRFDGFERVERSEDTVAEHPWQRSAARVTVELRRMLPDDLPGLDFREAESEVIHLLDCSRFVTAKGHLTRALSAFQRGAWSSANGELRNFYENYLNEIALALGCAGSEDSKAKRDFLGNVLPPFLLADYNEWNANNQKPQYVQGLLSRMHPHGGHPGLSEEEDATFRLQITLITARLFLRRYHQRISELAA